LSIDLLPRESMTPNDLIAKAIQAGNLPIEQLERLMALSERWESNQAAREFAEALTGFQSECPMVFKGRKTTGTGSLAFAFASMDDIMDVAQPLLAKYHIVPTWTTKPGEKGGLEVTCRIRVGTHAEESSVTIPIPTGTVNATQLHAQGVTYGKRYSLCAALGITVTDQQDNDASTMFETISKEQVIELDELLGAKNIKIAAFLGWAASAMRVKDLKTLDGISVNLFPRALDYLKKATVRK
jgi:ERF superfamily